MSGGHYKVQKRWQARARWKHTSSDDTNMKGRCSRHGMEQMRSFTNLFTKLQERRSLPDCIRRTRGVSVYLLIGWRQPIKWRWLDIDRWRPWKPPIEELNATLKLRGGGITTSALKLSLIGDECGPGSDRQQIVAFPLRTRFSNRCWGFRLLFQNRFGRYNNSSKE